MKIILEPSLYIMENEIDFFITTQNINLKLVLNKDQKLNVYTFIDKIKKNQGKNIETTDLNTFENKILGLFLNKGIAWNKENEIDLKTKESLPFNRIYGSLTLLHILKSHFDQNSQIKESNKEFYIHFEELKHRQSSVYLYQGNEQLYMSPISIAEAVQVNWKPIYEEYAAYSFLEFIQKNDLQKLTEFIIKMDLSIYTQTIEYLTYTSINEKSFITSIKADPILSNYQLEIDHENYFPLIYLQYYSIKNKKEKFHAIGFDQQDALRNLLFLLMEQSNDNSMHILDPYCEKYLLEQESFLNKYINIVLNIKGKEIIEQRIGNDIKDTANKCCMNSLFISYMLNHKRGEEIMSLIIYGQHIEKIIEQCISRINTLMTIEESKQPLHSQMILLKDRIYISNTQKTINEKMHQKSEKNAMYNYYHTSKEDIYKHIYYYFIHHERYSFISIDSCCIQMEIKHSIRDHELKSHSSSKRLESQVRMDELKYYVMEYKSGYIIKTDGHNISIMNREYPLIEGFGYEFDKNLALKKAMFEYLERCMASYELKDKIVDTYNNLKSQAINPEVFGLYNEKNWKLSSYEPDLILEWIEAKSLISNDSIYVPEQWVQYLKKDILNQYVYDSSNGSAIGNTYKEASFFSILEGIERDLFMRNWFYTHQFKRIEFDSAKETFLRGAELYFQKLGYDLEFYYMENTMNLPAVWCLIQSNDLQNNLYSITGLGCHLHITHAIKAAFFEAYKAFEDLTNQDQEKLLEEIQRVEKIKEIDKVMDHLYYFLSYESKTIIEEKLKGIESIYYSKLLSNSYEHIDIREELKQLINKASTYYQDILIVDQTNDFLENFSLHCTKAILIGSVPLDFTTHFIRPYHKASDAKIKQKNIHPLA